MAPKSRFPIACAALLCTGACALMPRELNLSPLWFHRLDAAGEVLEWDCFWPILHYERTPEGGDDFRIRPLWRRVTEPELAAVEHQFLCPFGRVRSDDEETSHRLWPLWSWRSRVNEDGVRDVDWYLLFPFVWGGTADNGREDYFAIFPLFADIPQFLSYDRFRTLLFPLFVQLDKGGHRHTLLLWPLIGFSSCAENDHSWFRILPFYGHDIEPGIHDRRFVLWPFFAWSTENQYSDEVDSFWLWPLFGWRTGRTVGGWMLLWPFFQSTWKDDHFTNLNLFWPFYHHYWNRSEQNVTQWWLWPFVGRVTSDDQRNWSILWPLIWWREYDNPDYRSQQQWVLPFWWRVVIQQDQGEREEFLKFWPLAHTTKIDDGEGNRIGGDWSIFSIWPWRKTNATGIEEAYGWLWELVVGRRRAIDDDAIEVAGRLFTRREYEGDSTASVPFLFNYERNADGTKTVRLLQFLPLSFGGSSSTGEEPQ